MSILETALDHPAVLVITGVMASGKSTVAQLLAERLPRAAHVRGDVDVTVDVILHDLPAALVTPPPTDW